MLEIWMVICDAGDGSNFIQWVDDEKVIDKMQELADTGDSIFSSGDGLQVNSLYFKEPVDLDTFVEVNRINFTTIKELEHY